MFWLVSGNVEWKTFFIINHGGQHLSSGLRLFSFGKFTIYFWNVKSNPAQGLSSNGFQETC